MVTLLSRYDPQGKNLCVGMLGENTITFTITNIITNTITITTFTNSIAILKVFRFH